MKLDFKKFFGRYPKSGKSDIRAERDWLIIITLFVVAIVLIVGASIFLYGEINEGDLFAVKVEEKESVSAIDKALLKKTLDFFGEKEERFNEVLR